MGAEGEFCLLDSLFLKQIGNRLKATSEGSPGPSLRILGSLSLSGGVSSDSLLGPSYSATLATDRLQHLKQCSLLFQTNWFFPKTVLSEGNASFGGSKGAVHPGQWCARP